MDEIRIKFLEEISARLTAAPDGKAKAELVEELAENLYQRYLEMTEAGVARDEAFCRAMEDLGDVEELINYLNEQPADDHEARKGESASGSGSRYNALDDLLHNVEEITRSAIEAAAQAVRNINVDEITRSVADAAKRTAEKVREEGFHVGINYSDDKDPSDPTAKKDWIYGVGYDKDKGGFFAQWGEWKGDRKGERNHIHVTFDGPISSDGIRGVDIQNVSGDLNVYLTQEADETIMMEGDVQYLEVTRTEDGTLLIRPEKTASGSFLSRRGFLRADITLYLPRRDWAFIRLHSVDGDITLEGDAAVETVCLKTVSGDVHSRLSGSVRLDLSSISGDVRHEGSADSVRLDSKSGDLYFEGDCASLFASTMSGDVEFCGAVHEARLSSMSGDVRFECPVLPEGLSVSSKSGDCTLRLPDEPFTAQLDTTSGDIDCEFPLFSHGRGHAACGSGGGPEYKVSTTSGDIRIEKY